MDGKLDEDYEDDIYEDEVVENTHQRAERHASHKALRKDFKHE